MPKALAYLYAAYWRMRRRKGGTGFGIAPIELGDIRDFIAMSNIRLAPWEVEIIEKLDDLFVTECAKSQNVKMQQQRERAGKGHGQDG